ncbi:MAG: serine/threonine-protein kinase [Gloeotrichia echinulata CP02]|jgi:serine/threonine protein kinase|nr:serine/threonine protein kinase [Gloeotrichia echinulata DEX184]
MICCLNPDCANPLNPDGTKFCLSCGTELVSVLRNRYRIIKPLGRGGFARTYVAEDKDKLDEQCVVKLLVRDQFYGGRGSEAQKKATELFEREAKRLQELGKHDQIPTLYAYFKESDYLYLVQEFIDGQNLSQELQQQGAFNEAKIRQLLQDLLPVIDVVHQAQVIHRDIKPENILRREKDHKLVLIDFGVSKQKTRTLNSDPNTIVGTPGYASPEQMLTGEVYPSSDLYSLGVTCFYLLTQIPPDALWKKQLYGWTATWEQHLQQPISDELRRIFTKLLQQDHEERYQSVQEVLQDLNRHPQSQTQFILTPAVALGELLPWAIIAGSGSSFLAIALLSFSITVWISSTLPLLIIGALIFTRSRSLLEKNYLFIIAVITTLFIVFLFQTWQINNAIIAAIIGGFVSLIIMGFSDLLNRLMSKYF